MTAYVGSIIETATADGALTRGYGAAMSAANEGVATADLTEAADETDGVIMHDAADGETVSICTFGLCDIYVADTTAARATVKCHTDGTWIASDANNAQAYLRTGGAAGVQKAFFYGKMRVLAPST